jgi:Protein of unknown function (DUF3574)
LIRIGPAMTLYPRLAAIVTFAVLDPLPAFAGACDWMKGAARATVQLLFGHSIPGGGTVSESEWQDFLATSVTPRFPDGLTVLDGHGQWFEQKSHQVITEVSTVVEIVTPPAEEAYKKLQAIRTEYMKRFHQEAVGLVVSNGCASF